MKRALLSSLGLLCLTVLGLPASAGERPNIVYILADDYGYGSAGCYGADAALVKTPAIDRLAKEGRRFTDANTTSSVCSPTRYSMLTGRYCWRTSLKSEVLSTFAPLHIETTRPTVASMLKRRGYETAAIGKWHLGYGTADDSPKWRTDYTAELSPGPLDVGFNYHFSVPSNHGDLTGVFVENRFVYGLRTGRIPPGMKVAGPVADEDENFQATYGPEDMENPARGSAGILPLEAPRRKNQRVMAELTRKATVWIAQQKKGTPFFLYFTPVAVHMPVTPDKDIAGQSKAGLYGDWIYELDRSVGAILEALEKGGFAQETLVVFTSDNGGVNEPQRADLLQTQATQAGLAINGALRGGKHHVWEGGFKVPFIVRWPGKVAAGTESREMISLADLFATTAEIVGEPLPPVTQGAEDSRSFLPALLGIEKKRKLVRDDMIVHSADGVFAIRVGEWKWIEGVPDDHITPAALKAHKDEFRPMLFNLRDDPKETHEVSAAHPEVIAELTALLNRYRNGGYSRTLPPESAIKQVAVATLPPLTGKATVNETLANMPAKPWTATGGTWTARDGGLWGTQGEIEKQGADLKTPCQLKDATIDYELSLDGPSRHSLRVEVGNPGKTIRVVITRTSIEIARNPAEDELATRVDVLALKLIDLQSKQWYPVRLHFAGDELTVQVNDVQVHAKHAMLAQPKTGLNFLVFAGSAGFRNLRINE